MLQRFRDALAVLRGRKVASVPPTVVWYASRDTRLDAFNGYEWQQVPVTGTVWATRTPNGS